MSKDFDSTLSDALDLAAHAARPAGPAAARTRGRQRAVRKRIALSTASVALVAVGATAAFQAASPHHVGTPGLTGSSSTVSVGATPTPGPSRAPSAKPSSSPATSTSTSTATPGSSASSPGVSADPHQVVASAWLAASQLPFASTFTWTATKATSQSSPIGTALTPTVFYVARDTGYQVLTACGDPAAFLSRTIGAQHSDYTPAAGITAKDNNQASQYIFFFADAGTAQQAYTWLQAQYTSSCLANAPGAQLKKTAGNATEATWMIVKGTSTAPDLPDYSREYFVLRGSTITYVSVTSYTQTLPTQYDDLAQLSAIAGHACVYGGPCQ